MGLRVGVRVTQTPGIDDGGDVVDGNRAPVGAFETGSLLVVGHNIYE